MRINPSQINAYASRPAARTGALVDTRATAGAVPARPAQALSGPRPTQAGTIQGVLTPEESRFIDDLFTKKGGDGSGGVRPGGYTHAGRPASGAIPGARLDLKG